ncbi:hypothetical protein [Rubrolithibacter danxiaensis]|uniref:hypothetical protein n=1 Tax=Rubrolithibacter danxiaensis TaxID=3390805 RepID=UPI003BF86875
MRYLLLLLPFVYVTALAQQKESTVSISCYVNPELYIQAGVIAYVSDKTGNVSCTGRYIHINNTSRNSFYYEHNNRWFAVKPQGKTVILIANTPAAASTSPSVLKLNVRYTPDSSGDITTKIRSMAQMNARTDEAKSGKQVGTISPPKDPDNETSTIDKPQPVKTVVRTPKKETTKKAVTAAKPYTPAKVSKSTSGSRKSTKTRKQETLKYATTAGLRIDLGSGRTGTGPNIKHKFNRNLAIDAALLFFEKNVVGLGGQLERNFYLKGTPGLNWYVGIGPQFLFGKENTATGLVPVTALEYNVPGTPLNFSFDWRPSFYLSPETDTETARFGLSLRVAF